MYNEMMAWRDDVKTKEKRIWTVIVTHSYSSTNLNVCMYVYACLTLFVNLVVHTFYLSISQLIIFNCSLVDRTCVCVWETLGKPKKRNENVYLFHSSLSWGSFQFIYTDYTTIVWDQSIHCVIFSWANKTWQWPLYIYTHTVYSLRIEWILFSVVEHL